MSMANSIEIFYSYSHEDESLRNTLDKHLALLKRQNLISGWFDREISAGEEFEGEIAEHLNKSQIILLLVSADFIASDYCYGTEMMQALERRKRGEARVIPVILRPVDWHSAPFGKLKALPKDGKAITTWANRDEAFLDVAKGIRKIVEDLSL